MECEKCNYCEHQALKTNTGVFSMNVCLITNIINPDGCEHEDIENQRICYNCKNWIGGGDWGLSCKADYYVATTNGFKEACKKFKRKETK